jgi:oligopeptide transport system substrate-binding protein
MRKVTGRRLGWAICAVALVLSAAVGCGSGGDDKAATDQPVRMELGEPQKALVPTLTTESEGSEVLNALFTPLVEYDANKKPIESVLAESITTTDNKKWTIKLKPGFTFHNGEKVTAQSFADAWNYGANQDYAQDANYFFGRIDGYADLNPGEGKKPKTTMMKGLKPVDDVTLEVTLADQFSQFKTMLGYTAFYPLPKAAFGPDGKVTKDFESKPIGNGYFQMAKPWRKGTDQAIDMVRYDNFAGTKPKVDKIQFKIYNSSETAFNDLRAENIDIHDSLPPSAISVAKTQLGNRYFEQPDATVGYIGFPLETSPEFKNVDVRKAISMAIDRKAIAEKVFSGTTAPADDYINPAIEGHRQGACSEACTFDPAKAKALYDKAGGAKTISLAYNSDGGHKEWIEAIANTLRSSLGIQVNVKPYEQFKGILDDLDARKYKGAFRMGWAIDYPSAENYLTPIFGTGAIKTGSNYGGYSNKEFDQLLVKGDTAKTPAESLKFYQQADDLLLRDLPYLPIYFYKLNYAISQHIKGVKINLLKNVEWTSVEKA